MKESKNLFTHFFTPLVFLKINWSTDNNFYITDKLSWRHHQYLGFLRSHKFDNSGIYHQVFSLIFYKISINLCFADSTVLN